MVEEFRLKTYSRKVALRDYYERIIPHNGESDGLVFVYKPM